MGGLTTAIGCFLIGFAISPVGTAAQVALCVTILLVTAVYISAQNKNTKEGIDISAIYAEVPPE